MNEQRSQVKSGRLIGTLGLFGAIAGLLIVVAFEWAQPRILADKAAVLQAAVNEVLGVPDKTVTLFVVDGALTETPPAGADTTKLERVFAGYNGAGQLVGYAITNSAPGFADVVLVIFGYDARSQELLGMKVIENKETPGLGDKIVKDTIFVNEFKGATTPLRGVKMGAGKGGKNEIDMITGATISSRVVIGIINDKLEQVEPMLRLYEGARP
jgi:Na+-translocating ferredoxin:NAD+ oxidoreductase subunit G